MPTPNTKTWIANDIFSAADLNDYLMKQTVIQAETTARPGSPQVGMTIAETDYSTAAGANGLRAGLRQYASATTGWVPPWNMAWGTVAYAQVTTTQAGITTSGVDLTGLIVIWIAIANRRYRIRGYVNVVSSATAQTVFVEIRDSGTTRQNVASLSLGATDVGTISPEVVQTISSGSVTRKLYAVTTTGTFDIECASTQIAFIQVIDDGPTGAPA